MACRATAGTVIRPPRSSPARRPEPARARWPFARAGTSRASACSLMPITGATQAVTAAATSVTITGTFATPYQISITPDWNTTFVFSGKTTAQFVITFGTPAPAGGGNVDWIVLSPAGVGGGAGTVTLANCRTELRRLLHDPNDDYWSLADKDSAINLGLQRRDLDSGQNRTLVSYTLVAGTDTYTLTTIGNTSVFDVVGIAPPPRPAPGVFLP